MTKVCSKTANWIFVLMLIVPGSVLTAEDPPSAQDQAVLAGKSDAIAPVPPALHQTLASSLSEATSIGAKAIPTPPTGTWGIVSEGDGGGGIFRDSDSEAEAWLGTDGYGVEGFGLNAGGYFKDSDQSGYAYVGTGDYGIRGFGTYSGGYFEDSDNTSYAYLGYGNYGVQGHGTYSGGYFVDSDNTGYANVGIGNYGIQAFGNTAGGYFKDSNQSGYSYAGYGDYGIQAYGITAGGYFEDIDGTSYANVGSGGRGIEAYGTEMGGYFKDSDATGYAYVGNGDYGIRGYGTVMGGFFKDSDSSGYASVGYGDRGIEAGGTEMGGYFEDSDHSGYAFVGHGDLGIRAYGDSAGGRFYDRDDSAYAHVASGNTGLAGYGSLDGGFFNDIDSSIFSRVAHMTYKIWGNGSVSFVQNHPYDSSSVIVYAAPEGDEVATYTRGTARLVEGEATVPLGETFKWVTNPDLGLTAYLTPVGEWCDLYVVEKATNAITVRSRDGSDCSFDFLVYGLRIGFEESSIVQEKEWQAYVPSMADHRQLYERRPDLKAYNSLERFKDMHHAINPKAKLDLSRAQALRDTIIEFDPAVHELPGPPRPEEMNREDAAAGMEGQGEGVQGGERVRTTQADQDRRLSPDHSVLSATVPVDEAGNVYATSFRPSSQDLASLVDVSEEVKPGDVLVIDPDRRGLMCRGSRAADNGVVGIVAAAPGVILGSEAEIGGAEASEVRKPSADFQLKVPVAFSGVVDCKVDASYGAVWTGNLLVTSPTPGHAMAQLAPLPGTVLGKALEPLEKGVGTIKVLVMLR